VLWLTWRQHRTQVLAIVALLAGTGVFLLVHGLHAADVAAGVAAPDLERALHDDFRLAYQGLGWLPWVPALVGVFWGAPLLAREFERGTFRIAWTQSVSRRRWLAVKLGGLGSLATLSGLGVGAMVGAWLHVFDGTRFAERFGDDAMFGSTGVASGAWWLFAFVLGTASGAVVRRLLPAIAVTVAVFVTVLFLVIVLGRGNYAAPVRVLTDVEAEPPIAGTMVVAYGWIDGEGREYADDVPACRSTPAAEHLDCLRDAGYRSAVYLHPADRYWRFQWTETGILLVLTAGLVWLTARRLRL
jgi:hypothetical protein